MARPKKRYVRAKDYKVDQVVRLCKRKEGCTVFDIMQHLGISYVAATSLIQDIGNRRDVKMTREWKRGRVRAKIRYTVWRIED